MRSTFCSKCPSRVRRVPLNESRELCGRHLFVEGWSDFFARSGSSSDFFAHDRQPSRPVLHSFAQYSDRELGLFPSLVHVLQSCWKQNWCHGDGTGPRVLETLRLASGWCTPADAGNMRTTSKEWYEAFEHTPDEITMARIEQNMVSTLHG